MERRIKTLIEREDGTVLGVDRRRLAQMPFFLLSNIPNNSITMPANEASIPRALSVSGEGPAQIMSFSAERTGVCRVFLQMEDGESIQGLMNRPIHIDTIFGTGAQPYRLPEALYIDETRSLVATLTDISGGANAARLNLATQRFLLWEPDPKMDRIHRQMQAKQYLTRPFFFTFNQGPVTLTAAQTLTIPIEMSQTHHFRMSKISAVSTGAFDMNIVEANKNEPLITGPQNTTYAISNGLAVGNANFPFVLNEPILYEAKSKLAVTLTNRTGVNNTIELTLGGSLVSLRMWSY